MKEIKNSDYILLSELISKFNIIHREETEKLPYHINIIDEIHADENAHSRIFSKLLQYKENNRHLFLEEFLNEVCGFKIPTKDLKIQKVDSCGRIDLPIFDNKYFIVIENKINGAVEQNQKEKGGQLARYIENIVENHHRDLKNIFIIYTPRYKNEPTDEIWINKVGYSYKKDFENRYKCISYNEIHKWLKEDLKPKLNKNDVYIYSAILQYIDYLDGIFSLREINNKMNMKLQDFIEQELSIRNKPLKETIAILSTKETELKNILTQINILKDQYQKKHFIDLFREWINKLKLDFSDLNIIGDRFVLKQNVINLGVEVEIDNKKYAVILESNNVDTENLYIGICTHFVSEKKHQSSIIIEKILEENKLSKPDNLWYGWKYTSTENSYQQLKELITNILSLK